MSDLRAALRQFAFDIVMSELGLDESDPDDQEFASEAVDAWMQHWDKTGARSEVASVLSDADLLGELVRRGIYPLDFMRWLGQHPVGPDGTAYFVGTGREPVGSVGETP